MDRNCLASLPESIHFEHIGFLLLIFYFCLAFAKYVITDETAGQYLAEITREVISDMEASKYQLAEWRVSIYGRKLSGCLTLDACFAYF